MSSVYKRLIRVGRWLYLPLQHTGSDVDTFQTSRLGPTHQSVSFLEMHMDSRKRRWVAARSRRETTMGLPPAWSAKQPSCHIYLRRRPNLSRRSAPFIPSGSSDGITTAVRSAWRHGSLSVGRSTALSLSAGFSDIMAATIGRFTDKLNLNWGNYWSCIAHLLSWNSSIVTPVAGFRCHNGLC